ncbi:glycyl-tRNA synthetase [Abortiporus biennis]|nr:glycyl-tRNA synthetase [Abortiporus biennis]
MAVNKTAHAFDKARLEQMLIGRFFFAPAFEIYGGVAGLYDYGPPGSALQANIIAEWRKHFIVEDHMLELDTTIMTPAPVFETSGHVARFADWMVKDVKTGEVLRADHLVKGVLEARLASDKEARGQAALTQEDDGKDKKKKRRDKLKHAPVQLADEAVAEYERILAQLDNHTGPELGELCRTHKITNPDTGNEVTEPEMFNLMFASSIGPTGKLPGFLRPETAQSHFLNFSRLLKYNNDTVPFASAQIGRSFRNEIAPKAGLLRVREFTMAEIEHFVDPEDKAHHKFVDVRDVELTLLDRETQGEGHTDVKRMTIGEAVDKGVVANETLGYFIVRIYQFLVKIGINPKRLRFRQHMKNEMAHYATDCWDAEIENSTGWTECVGCADRAAYDLTVHMAKTGAPLVVKQALPEPIVTEKEVAEFNKKTAGKEFGKDFATVRQIVENLDEVNLVKFKEELAKGSTTIKSPEGKEFKLTPDHLTVEKKTFKQNVREFTPNVIEPSFGIGRILYCLLEHVYWSREQDVDRGVLSLPPLVAPTKVLIVPLSNKKFDHLVKDVSTKLRKRGIFANVDDSNQSIGRRYARNDELGTPFGVTLDFASLSKGTMTLRERDTTEQLIGTIDEVIDVVTDLVNGAIDWPEAKQRLSLYDGVQAVD